MSDRYLDEIAFRPGYATLIVTVARCSRTAHYFIAVFFQQVSKPVNFIVTSDTESQMYVTGSQLWVNLI